VKASPVVLIPVPKQEVYVEKGFENQNNFFKKNVFMF